MCRGQGRALSAQDPEQQPWLPGPAGSTTLLSAPLPCPCLASPQWIIAELACYTYSMVVVPLYDTLGPGAIRYIINTGESTTAPSCHGQAAPHPAPQVML